MQGWKLITLVVLGMLLGTPSYSDSHIDGLMLAESDYDRQRREAQRRYLEMRERERAQKKQQQAREKHNKQVRAHNCQVARDRYREYTTSSGLYVYDKNGKRSFLDKQARKKAEAAANKDVQKWCGR
jgi:hypothetical protein